MARPNRNSQDALFNTFTDMGVDEQFITLKVLEQIHRQSQRAAKRNGKPAEEAEEQQIKLTEGQ